MGIKFDSKTQTWSASFSKRPGPNKAPVSRRRIGLPTEAVAKQWERKLVTEVDQAIAEKSGLTWGLLTEEYRQHRREFGIMEKTIYNEASVLEGHTLPLWKNRRIDTITTSEVDELFKGAVGNCSPSHQQYFLGLIRHVFQYAVNMGKLARNPTPHRRFRVGDKLKGCLNEEQVRRFLNRARELNDEWYPVWTFAIYTGMRTGELYALTWDKVDLHTNLIKVDEAWNSKDGFKSTKSGDDRYVEIALPLLPVIKELKLRSAASQYVLPRITSWGQGCQARELRRFLVGMGLPGIRFHDLRATWATLLLSKGVEPIKVMKVGGWKDMETMMIYIRKAGVDIRGATLCLNLHDPVGTTQRVVSISEACSTL